MFLLESNGRAEPEPYNGSKAFLRVKDGERYVCKSFTNNRAESVPMDPSKLVYPDSQDNVFVQSITLAKQGTNLVDLDFTDAIANDSRVAVYDLQTSCQLDTCF